MITFADELADLVRSHSAFWEDFEKASAAAMCKLLPEVNIVSSQEVSEDALWRLLRSASAFSQTTDERHKGLAQDIALFIAVTTKSAKARSYSRDLFSDLGNHPGSDRLSEQLGIVDDSLISSWRRDVLRTLNTVAVADRNYAFTDFQFKLWSRLPTMKSGAISAPTSAGKSFVIIEHLCRSALKKQNFSAVFVTPTRALLAEIHGKVSQRLADHEESIRISTIPTLDSENKSKQIFILTQERLQVLLAITNQEFDLIIVDEAQGIADDSRGLILQDCLEVIVSRSPAAQFLFLAPGASNFEALGKAAGIGAIEVHETDISPVVQNRIVVNPNPGNERQLDLSILSHKRRFRIGSVEASRGFGTSATLLAAAALELGSSGGSLVYGTGPADAENVAFRISSDRETKNSEKLRELSKFIKDHVHGEYSLVNDVTKGVAYHYGKMPSLLREALEEAFKSGDLDFLVCTTTLFQGVNLPAKNVFINTPVRGKKDKLDAAALWNFAGRAGRLGTEIAGNVYLVDYDKWDVDPFATKVKFSISPAFRRMVKDSSAVIESWLRGAPIENSIETVNSIESAGGLLMARAARGNLSSFVERTIGDAIPESSKSNLINAAQEAFEKLDLPQEALTINWTVNPFGQARLLKRFREKIKKGEVQDLIPVNPSPPSAATRQRYLAIFSRLNREIFGQSSSRKFNNRLTSDALAWMSGLPLPVIIKNRVNYVKSQSGNKKIKIDTQIRGVFEFVEDVLRFRYVQLGRCYIDLLRYALNEAGLDEDARSVYDFPLALELGVSSVAGQAFIELGLSRITAATLEAIIPDSNPSVERARLWIKGLPRESSKLSRIIWDEIERKGLLDEVSI